MLSNHKSNFKNDRNVPKKEERYSCHNNSNNSSVGSSVSGSSVNGSSRAYGAMRNISESDSRQSMEVKDYGDSGPNISCPEKKNRRGVKPRGGQLYLSIVAKMEQEHEKRKASDQLSRGNNECPHAGDSGGKLKRLKFRPKL